MEKEEKNQRVFKPAEAELFLQWGNRKRLRCVRMRDPGISSGRFRRRITSPIIAAAAAASSERQSSLFLQPTRLARNCSPEKEERYYTTRGSAAAAGGEEIGKGSGDEIHRNGNRGGGGVWPKLCIGLSSKEKEEDFMAMKGCKLPQRPKKRAKIIQRTLLLGVEQLVSPGAWLSDMCQERYEVREKKNSKKRPRGLKAMGNMDSDSE
ncbi:uncharacterized protein LOC127788924 isoform X2 [Diospyros lotus]|uniref:uncharacterized protein LOC127788924 isoform X2 n=1 Tax=Diospyros lotus TaxID=55363 RepID=UPI00224D3228|nr:uncharacterized protein LOC127788924 isoform X2 [Diospyros lotus]